MPHVIHDIRLISNYLIVQKTVGGIVLEIVHINWGVVDRLKDKLLLIDFEYGLRKACM